MAEKQNRTRIDILLTTRGFAKTRSRARDMIARGCVLVDGQQATKAGQLVCDQSPISLTDPAQHYVSRAALKLIAALDQTEIRVDGKNCVDLGASTGGFTQVLLERGAAHVTAIDVGHGQLVQELADDDRVHSLENTNARALAAEHFTRPIEIIVSDMSFVSLALAAEPTLILAAKKAQAALLVKPQFEVGKAGVGKGGIVKDEALIDAALERTKNWFENLPGWRIDHFMASPLTGGDGNKEFLLCGTRDG